MAIITVSHDPFARTELQRITGSVRPCAECGHPGKFAYRVARDDQFITSAQWSRTFCGIGCYRAHTS